MNIAFAENITFGALFAGPSHIHPWPGFLSVHRSGITLVGRREVSWTYLPHLPVRPSVGASARPKLYILVG